MRIKDYTGHKQENGFLTAIERIPYYKRNRTYYKCLCDCGSITLIEGTNFSKEHTISCGCKSSRNGTRQFDFLHQYRFDSEDKIYQVYKHTSPSGKVYIGMTKQSVDRRSQNGNGYNTQRLFWNAIQKYGWDNFEHDILEENLTHDEACEREIYYIHLYKSNIRKYGYNVTSGGDGCRDRGKQIAQIKNGIIVNVFSSEIEATKKLKMSHGAIGNYINDGMEHGGYILKIIPFEEYLANKNNESKKDLLIFKNNILQENNRKQISKNKKGRIAVCKYSLDGKFIEKYEGLNEAGELNNTSNICYAIKNNAQAGGFLWKYDDGDYSDIEPYNDKKYNAKAVRKIDKLTNKILCTYCSMIEAEKDTGISFKQIWKACNGQHKTSGGYIWEYAD